MKVTDPRDPVRLGRELTYEVRVSNDGAVADRQVVVVATVPPGTMPVPIGTSEPRQVCWTIDDQTIRFDPREYRGFPVDFGSEFRLFLH